MPNPNPDSSFSNLSSEITLKLINTIGEATNIPNLKNQTRAVIALSCIEKLASALTATCLKIMVTGNLSAPPLIDTPEEERLAALLLHNLTIRPGGTSFRTTLFQTCNEYEARYQAPSELGLQLLSTIDSLKRS